MGKRVLCILLSLLMVGGVTACTADAGQKRETVFLDVFDTASTITAYGLPQERFDADAQRLHGLLTEYHRLYDIYNTYPDMNNLKTVNDAAGGDPVAVDGRILDLLEYGKTVYDLTDGRVNILFGGVLALWHNSRTAALEQPQQAALPEDAALRAAAAHTDPRALEIDRAAGTVRIADPLARIDVGAIAKGYAVERAAEFAADTLGWTSALLNVGGNIRALGSKNGKPFRVGVQNPDTDSAREYLVTLPVTDAAVVTSGDYQRYFTVDGQRYAHIIDVDTLYPAAFVRSVTVVCVDSGLADALSTALFTLPVEEGKELLARHPGVGAVWVLTDGTTVATDGLL